MIILINGNPPHQRTPGKSLYHVWAEVTHQLQPTYSMPTRQGPDVSYGDWRTKQESKWSMKWKLGYCRACGSLWVILTTPRKWQPWEGVVRRWMVRFSIALRLKVAQGPFIVRSFSSKASTCKSLEAQGRECRAWGFHLLQVRPWVYSCTT